jgi:hypothetical protein
VAMLSIYKYVRTDKGWRGDGVKSTSPTISVHRMARQTSESRIPALLDRLVDGSEQVRSRVRSAFPARFKTSRFRLAPYPCRANKRSSCQFASKLRAMSCSLALTRGSRNAASFCGSRSPARMALSLGRSLHSHRSRHWPTAYSSVSISSESSGCAVPPTVPDHCAVASTSASCGSPVAAGTNFQQAIGMQLHQPLILLHIALPPWKVLRLPRVHK